MMTDSVYERIQANAKALKVDLYAADLAGFSQEQNFTAEQLDAISKVFDYLADRKQETIISTLLKMSHLPMKEPKTFDSFDFTRIKGRNTAEIRNLPTLSAVYARQNLAFIGPQGIGKTHLAMAYGRECCMRGMKTYFLKANELNQKLSDAVKYGRETTTINSLVKPSCLIIDEIGRCEFSKTNTRMFFDFIDRRYSKDGPNTTIFTSNIGPDQWGQFFGEDSSLLCALDRIFDDATVYMMSGDGYRGRKLKTVSVEIGDTDGPNAVQ